MTAKELRQKYLDFFVKRGHKIIPSAPLVPEHDPTVLFTTAGMHPLVPFLLGEPHPAGRRLVNFQKCLRTDDIDEVGDTFHHTFFEMLGNWSFGDYWKEEAISWSLEFLTQELGLKKSRLYISCFAGDKDAPKDEESAKIWRKLGIAEERVFFYGKKENWWGPAGKVGPCGPDTEMFYDTSGKPHGANCHPNDNCGRFFEIWNDVFMEYNKTEKGEYEPIKQKNVDTGMGVERTVAVLQGKDDDYKTELFWPIIQVIEANFGKKYQGENLRPMRIVADHTKAVAFLIAEGVLPAKVERGYVLRRLTRRAIDQAKLVGYTNHFKPLLAEVVKIYKSFYPELKKKENLIYQVFEAEESQYSQTIKRARKVLSRIKTKKISGEEALRLYATHGLPPQQLRAQGYEFSQEEFEKAFAKHQKISRLGAQKKFAGGLADHSEVVIKLHTTTHLLHQALRTILGHHVKQAGSNITAERLRFDFSHPNKLTEEEVKKVEDLVNQKIEENLPVSWQVKTLNEALAEGALAFFGERYANQVKVYTIGDFSKEVCGGPHVSFTGVLGRFKIVKEEALGTGVRRIYGILTF